MLRHQINLAPSNREEKAADQIINRLRGKGFIAYRVGGAVRDRLLGLEVHDVDVATEATPAVVRRLFGNTYAVGEAFAVIVVHTPEQVDVEVATFRREDGYADGRHPDKIKFSDPPTDAKRRDFTVNALYYDPSEQVILDFTGGLADLRAGLIRAIGHPENRFNEDHLRMLRAVRFAAAFGFNLEPASADAIRKMADKTSRISCERIFSELTRMLTGPAPAEALSQLLELGILNHLLPEVTAMNRVSQPPEFHPEGDVWQHTRLMLSRMTMAEPLLAWSTLLHDIGKPLTHEYCQGRDRFPNHAPRGAEAGRAILRRLKAPRRLIDELGEVIANHMNFMHVREMRPATLRRLLARPTFATELELHRLDCLCSHGKLDGYYFLLDQLAKIANQPDLPPPLINGHDLLALGLSPGPRIGELLRWAQDQQLAGLLVNRGQVLAAIQDKLASRESSEPEIRPDE